MPWRSAKISPAITKIIFPLSSFLGTRLGKRSLLLHSRDGPFLFGFGSSLGGFGGFENFSALDIGTLKLLEVGGVGNGKSDMLESLGGGEKSF
jgi:hypothetical protein